MRVSLAVSWFNMNSALACEDVNHCFVVLRLNALCSKFFEFIQLIYRYQAKYDFNQRDLVPSWFVLQSAYLNALSWFFLNQLDFAPIRFLRPTISQLNSSKLVASELIFLSLLSCSSLTGFFNDDLCLRWIILDVVC
ncbi:hypothetical protein F511_00833 [Dorcoceras hygrometricum]|nr:hypothetical protein F511_00833 [Dorcoceras hygrometricum]